MLEGEIFKVVDNFPTWLLLHVNKASTSLFVDNQYIDGYRSLFATAGRIGMDNSFDITRAYYKSVYCIFGFSTSPSLYHEEPQERRRNGSLRVNIEFRIPLPNSMNVIIYMEFDNNIFVDKTTEDRRLLKTSPLMYII